MEILNKTKFTSQDEKFILRCIDLSKESLANGDKPFAALIVKDGKIIADSLNETSVCLSNHAEILVMDKARKRLNTTDLSSCVLYSNCEPCAMCSFMIREYRIKKVVFSLFSPYMGGFTKWKILQDPDLFNFNTDIKKVPEICGGLLESEAQLIFKDTKFWMFGPQ